MTPKALTISRFFFKKRLHLTMLVLILDLLTAWHPLVLDFKQVRYSMLKMA
ncbi:hypothetical protein [Secundilactobacillus paracollinoides]|uniref:hypothetical protein n=1 Tax=Secundilactobacillus paracollinoides TaxID=240427 RepID=UPI001CDA95B8|nr:hypothetical protein [Secundilactobacillus paracollinoides]